MVYCHIDFFPRLSVAFSSICTYVHALFLHRGSRKNRNLHPASFTQRNLPKVQIKIIFLPPWRTVAPPPSTSCSLGASPRCWRTYSSWWSRRTWTAAGRSARGNFPCIYLDRDFFYFTFQFLVYRWCSFIDFHVLGVPSLRERVLARRLALLWKRENFVEHTLEKKGKGGIDFLNFNLFQTICFEYCSILYNFELTVIVPLKE